MTVQAILNFNMNEYFLFWHIYAVLVSRFKLKNVYIQRGFQWLLLSFGVLMLIIQNLFADQI